MKKIIPPKQQLFIALIALAVIAGLFGVGTKKISNTVPTPVDTTSAPETPTVWPSTEIKKETTDQSDAKRKITATYPITKSEAVNAYFKQFVDEQIKQFKDDTNWADDPEITSASEAILSFDITYTNTRSQRADNYIFTVSSYTGGAHGLDVTKTFSFSKEGKLIGLADLFSNGLSGLKTVAPYVQAELAKQNITTKDWIQEGAGPTEDNYRSFIVTDNGITVIFDPYQVAAYAAGSVKVQVPASAFKTVANKQYFSL
jgi:hypothetical protein